MALEMDPQIRALLACPSCHAELRDAAGPDGADELQCTNSACGLAYPVDDGIPVLLVDDARAPS